MRLELWVAMAAAGCVTGPPVNPALTAATPGAPPYADSVFARCTLFNSDSGEPGRPLQQAEVQPATTSIGACPLFLVQTSTSSTQASWPQAKDRHIYYLSVYVGPQTCQYANPQLGATNWTTCELAQPTPWPDTSAQ